VYKNKKIEIMDKVVDIDVRRRIKLFRKSMDSNPNFIYVKDVIEFPECSLSYKDQDDATVHLECLAIAKDANGDWYAVDTKYKYWRFSNSDIVGFKP
jgi:hypothetical protein